MIPNISYSWSNQNLADNYNPAALILEQSKNENCFILSNVDLKIKKGEFIGIFGEVGSGKSSLFHAILNNLKIINKQQAKEDIVINGELSYYSQIPWIINETIRNNILFFEEYKDEKYKEVLRICQLNSDLDLLPGKDLTEIGENAVNLSGGQKARIALARAIYANKSIYLFDDPLAALDKKVGDKIFFECFKNYLKKSTILLATHNLKYLAYFDRIIWLSKGNIIFNGKIIDLLKQEFFYKFTEELILIRNHFYGKQMIPDDNLNKNEFESHKEITEDILEKGGDYQITNIENNLAEVNSRSKTNKSSISIKFIENEKTKGNDSNYKPQQAVDMTNLLNNNTKNPFTDMSKKQKSSLSIISLNKERDIKALSNRRNSRFSKNNLLKFEDEVFFNNFGKKEIQNVKFEKSVQNKESEANNINACEFKLTNDENDEIGEETADIFMKYFLYLGGIKLFLFVLISCILWQFLSILSTIWLAEWTKSNPVSEDPDISINNDFETINQRNSYYLFIYTVLSIGASIGLFLRIWILSMGNKKSGESIHKDMINSIIQAPINLFHDITQKSLILNRLSKDLENVFLAIFQLGDLLYYFFDCLGCLLICTFYEIRILLLALFLIYYGFHLSKIYRKANKNLKQIEGVSRSKIVNAIRENINGIDYIRVFKKIEDYRTRFHKIIDDNLKINTFINGCYCWFNMKMELIVVLFLAVLLIFIIIFQKSFDPQAVAILIIYSSKLQSQIFSVFLNFVHFESDMVSMKRCLKFLQIPQEKDMIVSGDESLMNRNEFINSSNEANFNSKKLNCFLNNKATELDILVPDSVNKFSNTNQKFKGKKIWPEKGEIEFRNYTVKYRPETPVIIDKLSLFINAGEKIGVIGRTGCGKSTLCNSLFRILEPSSGTIIIDGEDITKIGLIKLRNSISIIPQEPFIFAGSLRFNLDPLGKYKDEEIENVLNLVGLKYHLTETGLSTEIEDNGAFSIGEKQLLSIARTILRVII